MASRGCRAVGHAAPVGPVCSLNTRGFGVAAPARVGVEGGPQSERHLVAARATAGPRAHRARLEAGDLAALPDSNRGQPTTPCSPSAGRVPVQSWAHCWDKSALLFAFIFSRRFTKWPLLTSSSSVLSSAQRSWKQTKGSVEERASSPR